MVILQRSAEVGQFLAVAEDVSKGMVLVCETSFLTTDMKLNTIQFENITHVALAEDGLLWRIQHSCDPNCVLIVGDEQERMDQSDTVTIRVVALRNIKKGTSISYNYNTTEVNCFELFHVHVGPSIASVRLADLLFSIAISNRI